MGGGGGGGWKDLRADQGSVMKEYKKVGGGGWGYHKYAKEPQLVRNGRSLTRHGGCFLIIVVGKKKKEILN